MFVHLTPRTVYTGRKFLSDLIISEQGNELLV